MRSRSTISAAGAQVEPHVLREGHAWVGVEVCSGTRFGPDEVPSGGIANLHKTDPDRYGTLDITGGRPEHWPNLQPGVLGKAFETINFSQQGWEMLVFRQELARSYAQGPDIYFSVVEGLRTGNGSPLGRLEVRRVYTSGTSGGTEILRPLAQYHHDNWMQSDGGPILDGYFIIVGQLPEHRPAKAAVVVFQTEASAHRRRERVGLPRTPTLRSSATARSRAPVACSRGARRRGRLLPSRT